MTAGQNYHWAVEALDRNGNLELELGSFKTKNPQHNIDNTFSSVSVINHGFKPPTEGPGIPDNIYDLGNNIASSGGNGLVMQYNSDTGGWDAIDEQRRLLPDVEISDYYGKPLVLLTDWSPDNQSSIPDSGFSEGAADAFYTSIVKLDQQLGGTVENIDGKLVNKHGAVFNSPLHFIGFSRGTVVTSEMVQRIGTHFPHAGGPLKEDGTPQLDSEGSEIRDLQMTTIDPHDFEQPGFSFPGWIPVVGGEGFADFNEPQVQIWENVTFADNYYQTVPKLDPNLLELTGTPAGRLIENADLNVFLGTSSGQENHENSRAGFTRETDGEFPLVGRGATHGRVVSWYDGTTNLSVTKSPDELYRRLGDGYHNHLYDPDFSGVPNPWYTPDHKDATFQLGDENAPWEGIGTGWFYSVLGGGKDLRPESKLEERISVSFDNTGDRDSQGDFPVPTVFNGNFEIVTNPDSILAQALNTTDAIPGWSLHNSSELNQSTPNIVTASAAVPLSNFKIVNKNRIKSVRTLAGTYPSLQEHLDKLDSIGNSHALELRPGEAAVHNRFRVPEAGTLKFDIFVPDLNDQEFDNNGNVVKVYLNEQELKSADPLIESDLGFSFNPPYNEGAIQPNLDRPAVDLRPVELFDATTIQGQFNRIGYGMSAFETFSVHVPPDLRGQSAQLRFEVLSDSGDGKKVYIDNIAFGSDHTKMGIPTLDGQLPRLDNQNSSENYLVEKPQYVLSYNNSTKNPNWVSWQLNNLWLGEQERSRVPFARDISLPFQSKAEDNNYRNSIYIRGHLAASADRTRSGKDNVGTFILSNILPQSESNATPWTDLEEHLQTLASNGHDIYIVAGGRGLVDVTEDPWDVLLGDDPVAQNNIGIPSHLWKVALVLDRPGYRPKDISDRRDGGIVDVIAVDIPNDPTYTLDTSQQEDQWTAWRVAIDSIEGLTGLDFLSSLPDEVEERIEARKTFRFID